MDEVKFIEIIIQSGGIGIALFLIWCQSKQTKLNIEERSKIMAINTRTLDAFRKVVANHLTKQQEIDLKMIQVIQELKDFVHNLNHYKKNKKI